MLYFISQADCIWDRSSFIRLFWWEMLLKQKSATSFIQFLNSYRERAVPDITSFAICFISREVRRSGKSLTLVQKFKSSLTVNLCLWVIFSWICLSGRWFCSIKLSILNIFSKIWEGHFMNLNYFERFVYKKDVFYIKWKLEVVKQALLPRIPISNTGALKNLLANSTAAFL